MNELALFAGAGGGILASKLLGWNTVGSVEIEDYPRQVLLQRQRDGILPKFPIWDDIRTFDGKPWRGIVDVVSGGFPCQDISTAGKGAGIEGERSGLWSEMARVIREVRPRFAFMENSPALTSRGLHRVLGDLAEMGFNARWGVLGADDCGAPHRRKRIWVLAHSNMSGNCPSECETDALWKKKTHKGREGQPFIESDGSGNAQRKREVSDATMPDVQKSESARAVVCKKWGEWKLRGADSSDKSFLDWWEAEPRLDRVADGMANQVDRLKSIGNGQVPAVAATAFTILSQGLEKEFAC